MDFKYKTIAEITAMTDAEKDAYGVAKRTHEADLVKTQIEEATKALKDDNTKLAKTVKEQGVEMAKIKENGKVVTTKGKLLVELKENKDAMKSIAEGGGAEIQIKALVSRASVVDSPSGFMLPEIGQLGVKERSLYNVLPKVTIGDNNTHGDVRYRDWDESTVVRSAAMVAEGAIFPESTAGFRWYTAPLKKVGDTLPVTEEFFEDEAAAASELEMFLEINVSTEIDDQLINGNNVGQNLNGLLNSTPAFTAIASGIPAPNLKDLSIKMRNTITRTRGSKYRPDMVVVSSSTMETLVLAKNANDNYIFDESTGTLAGMMVVVDENMPDDQMIVGDRRYAVIYEKAGLAISKGTVGTQFTEDELTLKARKRMLFLIREVNKTGFLKSTGVLADLVTLGM